MNANEFLTLRNAMDRFFQDSYERSHSSRNGNGNGYEEYVVPRADAWEDENQVTIELSLPGIRAEAVDITVEQDTLTVQGRFPQREGDKNWILRERPQGGFQRRFTLNVPVDVNSVEASYNHGLLTLALPKSEESKPRKIEVKAG